MYENSIDKKVYADLMASLKRMTNDYHLIQNSDIYLKGQKYEKIIDLFKSGPLGFVKNMTQYIRNKLHMRKLSNLVEPLYRQQEELTEANYFSDQRIVVYTCVFGKYDLIYEPYSHPDNIDYYIITDQQIPSNSIWKRVDISQWENELVGLSDVEKNRWFKMHPHIVFNNYKYSIYIDGNVLPVTDFTELVNRIGKAGIAMYWHSYNNCVYQEAYYNRYSVKKIKNKELENHISYLKKEGMPENFGMTTCNVIARNHTNDLCRKIMDEWWAEFMRHCRRDQISFPYVVWKSGLEMKEIAKLGNDVWNADTLLVYRHI